MNKCILLLTLALGVCATAAPLRIELPQETPSFKQAAGVEVALQRCLVCHSSEYVTTQPPLSSAAWKASVEKMRAKFGAQIPPEQAEALVEYLARNYGAAPR